MNASACFNTTPPYVFKSILKKTASTADINPYEIEPGNIDNVSREKLRDVEKLLNIHYGETWMEDPNLSYFKKILHEARIRTKAITNYSILILPLKTYL